MIIDHTGMLFFPQVALFRIIGRLAFPLFAWFIAHGAYHTRDIKKYMLRLCILAFISQIPYTIFLKEVGITHFQLNVVFTLCSGLFTIFIFQKIKSTPLKFIITLVIAVVTFITQADYGIIGVVSIVLFYIYQSNTKMMFWSQLVLYAVWVVFFPVFFLKIDSNSLYFFRGIPYQLIGVMSITIIALYNKKKSRPQNYAFYLLYPLHLLVLTCLSWAINL